MVVVNSGGGGGDDGSVTELTLRENNMFGSFPYSCCVMWWHAIMLAIMLAGYNDNFLSFMKLQN